jgi:hypothetical protein
MSEQLFDPKLKECAAKIQEIMDQYGCGGAISLSSKTHGEFLIHFPTWADMELQRNGLRIFAKTSDLERASDTAHFLFSQADTLGQFAMLFIGARKQFTEEIEKHGGEVEHKPFHKFTPAITNRGKST